MSRINHKWNKLLFTLLGIGIFMGASAQGMKLDRVKDFGENPGKLKMYLYTPAHLIGSNEPIPLVVALHGCSQNASILAGKSGWTELADKFGFRVLYPEQRRSNNLSDCFNWFHHNDVVPESGELRSILEMITYTVGNFPTDENQICVWGVSAGGAMANALLVHEPCLFRAGAILAGGPYGMANNPFTAWDAMRDPPEKTPQEWAEIAFGSQPPACMPHIILLHGEEDKVVNPRCSIELRKQWMGAITDAPGEFDPVSVAYEYENVRVEEFLDGSGEKVVTTYFVSQTGHVLPIDPGSEDRQGGKIGTFFADRDFFSTWYIARDFGLIPR